MTGSKNPGHVSPYIFSLSSNFQCPYRKKAPSRVMCYVRTGAFRAGRVGTKARTLPETTSPDVSGRPYPYACRGLVAQSGCKSACGRAAGAHVRLPHTPRSGEAVRCAYGDLVERSHFRSADCPRNSLQARSAAALLSAQEGRWIACQKFLSAPHGLPVSDREAELVLETTCLTGTRAVVECVG